MKKRLFLVIMLSIVLIVVMGCGDNGKEEESPTGGGGTTSGSLTDRPDSPNAAVTTDNVQTVMSEVNNAAWEAFGKAMETVSYGKATADITSTLDGEINGDSSGKAVVKGKMVSKMDGQTPKGVDYDFTCTYYDYSDDGELFLGGSMTYKGSATYTGYQLDKFDITVKGNISFNGKYRGTQDFTTVFTVTGTGQMSYQVTTTVTSGGETFTTTYTY